MTKWPEWKEKLKRKLMNYFDNIERGNENIENHKKLQKEIYTWFNKYSDSYPDKEVVDNFWSTVREMWRAEKFDYSINNVMYRFKEQLSEEEPKDLREIYNILQEDGVPELEIDRAYRKLLDKNAVTETEPCKVALGDKQSFEIMEVKNYVSKTLYRRFKKNFAQHR